MKKAEDAYERALTKLKEYEQAVGDTQGADLLAAGGAMANGQEAPSQATNVGANETQPAEPAKMTEGQTSVSLAKGTGRGGASARFLETDVIDASQGSTTPSTPTSARRAQHSVGEV